MMHCEHMEQSLALLPECSISAYVSVCTTVVFPVLLDAVLVHIHGCTESCFPLSVSLFVLSPAYLEYFLHVQRMTGPV